MIFDVYARESMLLVLMLSGIPLLASAVAGLAVGILQAATQVQDQTISFVIRCVAVGGTIALLSDWYVSSAIEFFQKLLSSIVYLGAM